MQKLASENHDLARKLNPCQKWILGGLAVFCMDCHADKSAHNDRQGALCEKVDSRGFGVLCLSTCALFDCDKCRKIDPLK